MGSLPQIQKATTMLAVLMVAMLLAMTSTAVAQSTAINGSIRDVTDQSGAAVPGAVVTITNTGRGLTKTANTDENGYYAVPTLSLGSYEVTIKKDGFQGLQYKNVILEAGKEAVLDGQLSLVR